MEPELELGHDAEVAAAPTQTPVEVRVLGLARADHAAVGKDHLERGNVVAGEAVLSGEPAHPAAEGEAADTGVGHVPGGGGKSVQLRGPVE